LLEKEESMTYTGEKTASLTNGTGKIDYMQNTETRPIFLTLCKKSTPNGSNILM
jgi:hypothetical protein